MRRAVRKNTTCRRYRGAAMVLVLILMLLLSLIGMSALQVGYDSRKRAILSNADIAARYAADAGVEQTLYLMNNALAAGAWSEASVPMLSSVPLASGNANYTVTLSGSAALGYQIVSVGLSGTAEKTVRAALVVSGPPYAILVGNKLEMKNAGVVDGSCGTLSSAPDAFDIDKSVIINDAFVGVGGDPSTIDCAVQGEKYALTTPVTLSSVSVPSSVTTAGPNTNWNTPNNSTLGSLGTTTYVRYTGVTINGTLNISGDVVMYVDGDLSSVGSGINVNANSSLKLYITGDLGPGNNGVDLSSAANDPSALKIYGVGTSSQEFNIGKNKNNAVAAIYAPNADITIGKNGAVFTGQLIANSFLAKNAADIVFDTRAIEGWSVNDPLARFVVKDWHE